MDAGTSPARVGRQLATRREDLDITQQAIADTIGISARTVSAIERGQNQISRGKRPAWEEALKLEPGTISAAYRDGTPIRPVRDPNLPDEPDQDVPSETDELRAIRGLLERANELLERYEKKNQPDRDQDPRDQAG